MSRLPSSRGARIGGGITNRRQGPDDFPPVSRPHTTHGSFRPGGGPNGTPRTDTLQNARAPSDAASERAARPSTGAEPKGRAVPMLELGRNLPSGAPAVSRGRSSYLSDASSKVDQRLNNFQEIFTRKFQTKFTKLGDRFRFVDEDKRGALGKVELSCLVDEDKRGALGKVELKRVFEKMSAPVDDAIINKLLNRCENPEEGVTLKEFGALLGNETQPMSLLQNRDPGGNFGDNAKQKFLWVPAKNTKLGSLNDTLEAEKIEKGLLPPRLDLNFSGVRYDIISLGHGLDRTPASVRVPVKNRLALFDPPPPNGRKVAYDLGALPYHLLTHRTMYPSGSVTAREPTRPAMEQTLTRPTMHTPVRLSTFTRGFYQEGHSQGAQQLTFTCC